jgi:hypothetical protein
MRMRLKGEQKPPHKPGVYSVTNTITGRTYFGSAVHDLRRRWDRHHGDLRAGKHWLSELQHDYDGGHDLVFAVLEITTSEDAQAREHYWASKHEGEQYNVRSVQIPERIYHCPACGVVLASAHELGQARRFGHCRMCKSPPVPRPQSYRCPNCHSRGLSWQAFAYAKGSGRCTRYCTGETTPPTTPDEADVFAELLATAVQALAAAGCTEEAVDALRRAKRVTVMSLFRAALVEQSSDQ